ncbi:UNVERIFIED_CONTAM: hypothetical protein RMT77_006069 [Armadillidium vulgare]
MKIILFFFLLCAVVGTQAFYIEDDQYPSEYVAGGDLEDSGSGGGPLFRIKRRTSDQTLDRDISPPEVTIESTLRPKRQTGNQTQSIQETNDRPLWRFKREIRNQTRDIAFSF